MTFHVGDSFPPNALGHSCPVNGKTDGRVLQTTIQVFDHGGWDRILCFSVAGAMELGQAVGMTSPKAASRTAAKLKAAKEEAAALKAHVAELEAEVEKLNTEIADGVRADAAAIAQVVDDSVRTSVAEAIGKVKS